MKTGNEMKYQFTFYSVYNGKVGKLTFVLGRFSVLTTKR